MDGVAGNGGKVKKQWVAGGVRGIKVALIVAGWEE